MNKGLPSDRYPDSRDSAPNQPSRTTLCVEKEHTSSGCCLQKE